MGGGGGPPRCLGQEYWSEWFFSDTGSPLSEKTTHSIIPAIIPTGVRDCRGGSATLPLSAPPDGPDERQPLSKRTGSRRMTMKVIQGLVQV